MPNTRYQLLLSCMIIVKCTHEAGDRWAPGWSLSPVDRYSKIKIIAEQRQLSPAQIKDKETTYSSFLKSRRTSSLYVLWKAPWRSKGEGAPPHSRWCQPTHKPLCYNPSWLGDARRTWEDPEKNQIWTQNQTKQDDWLKETQKKCLIYKGFKVPRGRDSFSEPARVSSHMYPFSS